MKKQIIIGISLLVLLSTINIKKDLTIKKFNIKEINVVNNFLIKDKEIKDLLIFSYNTNLIFLNNSRIEEALKQNTFIEGFKIKKKYPNTLNIEIIEKEPFAILLNKKKKFYLSKKIDLIEYKKIKRYESLPYVFGNKEEFEIFYKNLKAINFPFDIIKNYTFFDSKRWDLEILNGIIVKLPRKNYNESLKNFLKIKNKNSFKKYLVFDYRIPNQLILK